APDAGDVDPRVLQGLQQGLVARLEEVDALDGLAFHLARLGQALERTNTFERAEGRCQRCGRQHLVLLRCLPDGRWFDEQAATWRDHRGRPARWPDLMEATRFRTTRVVLAAAHLDSDPTNNRLKNLRALCQRCHMLHDRPHHLQRRTWTAIRPTIG